MVEHVFPFGCPVHLHYSLIRYWFQSIRTGIHLLQGSGSQYEQVLSFFIQFHVSPTGIHLVQQFGFMLAQIHLPHIKPTFERRKIIQLFTVFRKDSRGQTRRIRSQTDNPVLNTVQFHHNVLCRLLLFLIRFLIVFFLIILLIGSLILFLFQFLLEFIIFLAQAELVVRILVDENQHHIVQRTPRSMVTHTVTFGSKENGVTVHYPAWRTAGITASGQIDHLSSSVGTYQADIGIRVVTVADAFQSKPFSVGRPAIREITVGTVPQGTVSYLSHLLGSQIDHHQPATVFDEGHFLAIGRELRIHPFHGFRRKQHFFVYQGSVRKIRVFLPGNPCRIELPVSGPFAGIHQGTVIGSKRKSLLGGRRMSNLLGSSIFYGSDKHFSTDNESHLLAIRRNNRFTGPFRESQGFRQFGSVGNQRNGYFLRLSLRSLGIDFSVVGITQGTVSGYGKETDRMSRERSQRLYLFRIIQREPVDIERTFFPFAQEIHLFTVGSKYRVPVFSGTIGQIGMLSGTGIIHPDIAGDGRGMMFAPFVFEAFPVLIQENISRRAEADHLGRSSQYLTDSSTGHRYLIQFGHGRGREQGTTGRILDTGREQNVLTVG